MNNEYDKRNYKIITRLYPLRLSPVHPTRCEFIISIIICYHNNFDTCKERIDALSL